MYLHFRGHVRNAPTHHSPPINWIDLMYSLFIGRYLSHVCLFTWRCLPQTQQMPPGREFAAENVVPQPMNQRAKQETIFPSDLRRNAGDTTQLFRLRFRGRAHQSSGNAGANRRHARVAQNQYEASRKNCVWRINIEMEMAKG